jgi:hypothetical protein
MKARDASRAFFAHNGNTEFTKLMWTQTQTRLHI